MLTRNILPCADNEGTVGSSSKTWAEGRFYDLYCKGTPWIDVRIYGETTGFALAVAAIGSTSSVLYIPNEQSVTGDVTVPATLTLKFSPGGFLNIATTKTATINGNIEAGLTKIFSCVGTGKVVFGAGAVKEVYPEWWETNTTPGTTDMTVAIQAAIDGMTENNILKAKGTYKTSATIWIRKSNCTYDFRQAKFTGHGMVIVGDWDNPTVIPENITILGGEYRPDATTAVYPDADRNALAVIIGTNITIINPRIFPKQGCRAISIQTDISIGSPPYANIRRVRVYGLEIYGDGNAFDGVDIGSDGADNMIQDVYVEGFVTGCKQGVHGYCGSESYRHDSINLDLTIRDATVEVGTITRLKNSNVRINAINATVAGLDMYQFFHCKFDLAVHGTGASLTDAVFLHDGGVASDDVEFNIRVCATGGAKWATGLKPHIHNAVYAHVMIDGATLGINTAGYNSIWGLISLKNCTTTIDNLGRPEDFWGKIIDVGNWEGRLFAPRLSINGGLHVGGDSDPGDDNLSVDGTIRWGGPAAPFVNSGEDGAGLYVEQKGTSAADENIRIQTSKSGDGANYVQFNIDPTSGFSFVTLGTGNGKVGIGTETPAVSAVLDLTSTTGALLLPRMTTTQRDALTAANGMIIYNSTLNKFQGYENGAWTSLI